jgi:hypothetical protein
MKPRHPEPRTSFANGGNFGPTVHDSFAYEHLPRERPVARTCCAPAKQAELPLWPGIPFC